MLTKKEIEVLKLKKKGLTQVQIAQKLNIAQSSVCIFLIKAKKKIKQATEDLNVVKELDIKIKDDKIYL